MTATWFTLEQLPARYETVITKNEYGKHRLVQYTDNNWVDGLGDTVPAPYLWTHLPDSHFQTINALEECDQLNKQRMDNIRGFLETMQDIVLEDTVNLTRKQLLVLIEKALEETK